MNVEVLHLLIPRFTMTPNAYVFIAMLWMLKLPFKIGPILLSQQALIRCYRQCHCWHPFVSSQNVRAEAKSCVKNDFQMH